MCDAKHCDEPWSSCFEKGGFFLQCIEEPNWSAEQWLICVSNVEKECRSGGAPVFIYSNDGSNCALGGRVPLSEVLPVAGWSTRCANAAIEGLCRLWEGEEW